MKKCQEGTDAKKELIESSGNARFFHQLFSISTCSFIRLQTSVKHIFLLFISICHCSMSCISVPPAGFYASDRLFQYLHLNRF